MASAGPVHVLAVLPGTNGVSRTVSHSFDAARDARRGGAKVVLEFGTPTGTERRVRDLLAECSSANGSDGWLTVRVTEIDPEHGVLPDRPADSVVRIVLGPGTDDPDLVGEAADRGWTIERVPTDCTRRLLVRGEGPLRGLSIFLLAFAFYLFLGRVTAFDVITGAASALLVAAVLTRVVFVEGISPRRTGARALRSIVFLPYLLWEIVRANLAVAAVILHPRLPIEPRIERVETGTRTDLERAVLATSITLTPGTVALAVRDGEFRVHSLTEGSRESLRRGTLERAVRFVFHGRVDRPETADRGHSDPEADR